MRFRFGKSHMYTQHYTCKRVPIKNSFASSNLFAERWMKRNKIKPHAMQYDLHCLNCLWVHSFAFWIRFATNQQSNWSRLKYISNTTESGKLAFTDRITNEFFIVEPCLNFSSNKLVEFRLNLYKCSFGRSSAALSAIDMANKELPNVRLFKISTTTFGIVSVGSHRWQGFHIFLLPASVNHNFFHPK